MEEVINMPFANILQAKLNEIPNEDPMKFFKYMYSTIHPGMVNLAVNDAKQALTHENKRTGKPVNVYLTLGGDGQTQSLYTGVIATLLWLQEYIDIAKSAFNISSADVETCKKVLRMLHLPTIHDHSSSCREYASFLGSIVQWLSNGAVTSSEGPVRTNMELSRYLSSLALNSFPSIPFTAYYIGSVKTDSPMTLAEKLSKVVDFNKYTTPESLTLNQPKFVVQTENSPLIGISGHPLANMVYGQVNNNNVEWFGLFNDSEEFSKICVNNGVSISDVKKYIYQTTFDQHQKNIATGDKIALFIQQQNIIKEIFELRNKEYNVNNVESYEV